MNRRVRTRAMILGAVSITATLLTAPAGATAATADVSQGPPVVVRGAWTDPDPMTVVSAQPLGADLLLTATGSSTWSGALTGTTTYTVSVLVDPGGHAVGTIDETFVGTVDGIGTGRLHFTEAATQGPDGELRITAIATGGDGDLGGVTGAIRFVGSTDPSGVGGGHYAGTLVP